jgi:hypothetical protein
MGAGEIQVLTQGLDEEAPGLDIELPPGSVNGQGDVFTHEPTSFDD